MSRLIALASCVSVLLLTGCSNNADAICDKRKECFEADLDTGKCADKIGAWEDEKESEQDDRRARTAECAECISDRTCSEVLASCIDDCFGIP
ncbi:hypothetical protein KH5H1_23520 [Corallococcus caeni]|uniref:Lipoprotein n=2 Tax=Corallococcus TaxID=83461 RepID=A0A7Y4KTJ4_9BACT|nr:hypothetical protein [Corallococcus exercitus]NOK39045.1 hypothetical protein [Corallococcus exercitus]GMT98233.1 hypothetical protein KH5H1_23520 [Corallococcus sp. KH5-1]GMU06961.1 hypothetical protein ASNO1_32140 [Corallococcus sp. NO1]